MRWSLPLFLLALATPALAVEGVLEINQTCANQSGCFPGDTPGFPVTITATGSYRLTSNLRRLQPLGQTTDFIEIIADDVSLDLGGFNISCHDGQGNTCTGSGSGVVVTNILSVKGSSVKNGSISGMAAHGVVVGGQAEVTGLRVRGCGGSGIRAHAGGIVAGNVVHENDLGISGNGGSGLFLGNNVHDNDSYGFSLSPSDVYRENVITGNGMAPFLGLGTNRGDNYCDGAGAGSSFCP
jgi:hypothetical protein